MLKEAPQSASVIEDASVGGRTSAVGRLPALSLLLKQRWFILGLGALAVVLAVAFSWQSTPRYTATAQILLRWQADSKTDGNARVRSADHHVETLSVGSQARVVASDTVLRRAIAAAGLRKDDEFNAQLRPLSSPLTRTVLNLLGLRNRSVRGAGGTQPRLLQALRQRLRVTREPDARVLTIAVYSERAEKAARIANIVAHAYQGQLVADRAARIASVTKASQGRLAQLRAEVQSLKNKLAGRQATQGSADASRARVTIQELSAIDTQLSQARAALTDAKAGLAETRRALARPGSIPTKRASPLLRAQSRRLSAVRIQKVRLSERLRARHPDMVALSAVEQRLRRQVIQSLRRMNEVENRSHERLQAKVRLLTAQAEAMRQKKRLADAAEGVRRELVQRVAAARKAYATARAKSDAAKAQAGNVGVRARILTTAIAPRKKTWPPGSMILLPSALLVGLGLGSGLTLLRRNIRPVSESHEVQFALPDTVSRKQGGDRLRVPSHPLVLADLRNVGEEEIADATLPPDKDIRAIELATTIIDEPDGVFAQHIMRLYKALWPNLKSATPRARSLLVAPDHDAPMTSAIALGLALAGTSMGDRVLIVDGDVQKRRLSRSLLVPMEFGLQDVLSGRCKLADAVIVDPYSKVEVLILQDAQTDAPAVFGDEGAIRRLLAEAKAYDLVVIDGGEGDTLAAECGLTSAVDDVVAIVGLAPCERGDPDKTLHTLPAAAATVRGIVLIDAVS